MRTKLSVLLCLLVGMILLPTSPASADDCPTPGCGGYIVNHWESQAFLLIANNLVACGSTPQPPYLPAGYCPGTDRYTLSRGQSSKNIYNDTDAFYVPGNCTGYQSSRAYVGGWHKMTNLWQGAALQLYCR